MSNLEFVHEWFRIAFILDLLSRFDKSISYVREGGITFSLAIIPDDWELLIKELKAISEWNGTIMEHSWSWIWHLQISQSQLIHIKLKLQILLKTTLQTTLTVAFMKRYYNMRPPMHF